ncbi:hypothetical protein CPB85DRAFT_434698 [Mucidula mucida]|nr:hypothetical protein CPB85DRAFT_434698 [Mucidula mucida]
MFSMPSKFPDHTRRPPGLSSAFDGRHDAHTHNYHTQARDYARDRSSNVANTFGNVGGQFSGSQASYSYGSDESPDDATPSLHHAQNNGPYYQSNDGFSDYQRYQQNPPSCSPDNSQSTHCLPNNGAGYDQQLLYNNQTQSYAHAPSQQLPPTNATGQYFLPGPPEPTPPSPIPQPRVQTATATTCYAQSLPVPATSLSSLSDALAEPKGRQSKTITPAAPKADKNPAARRPRKASAAEQESAQDNNSGLAAKVPAKRGRKRKAPLPEPAPVTQPVSASADIQAPAAAQEGFKVASVAKSQAAPSASNAIVQSATKSSRYQSQPPGDTAVEGSSTTTLNKRKRDEQVDDAQRDRDLMPPPAAPRSNFSNGKGKGRAVEPPAPIATNNQVNPNVGVPQATQSYNSSTIQFVLPSGLITLAQDPASYGGVWIFDQKYTGVAWPATIHTCEELADFAYKKAVNASFQRVIYLPMTNDGKFRITSLFLLSLGSPQPRNQVRFDALAVNTARVFPPQQMGRFLEQLQFMETRRRNEMMFEENSSGGPSNPTPSNRHPHVGASSSNRQVQQAMQPTSSSGYPSGSGSNSWNHRFLPQEQGRTQPNVQVPHMSSTFSFASEPLHLPTSSESTARQELPYPFSSYPPTTVPTSDRSPPAEDTAREGTRETLPDVQAPLYPSSASSFESEAEAEAPWHELPYPFSAYPSATSTPTSDDDDFLTYVRRNAVKDVDHSHTRTEASRSLLSELYDI